MNEVAPLPRGALAAIGRQTAADAKGDIKTFFEANRKAIAGLVAGKMDVDRLILVAHNAIRANPTLAQCSVKSLFGATIVAGMLRLEPNTPSGDLFFIPRKGKNGWEVNVQIGYKGRRLLALRSPTIRDVTTHVAYANDDFKIVEGSNPHIHHVVDVKRPRGEPIVYYARAQLKSGSVVFEHMSVADIEAHRDRYSDAYKYAVADIESAKSSGKAWLANKKAAETPWINNFDAMARKTVLIALCARQLPIDTTEAAIASALDDQENRRQRLDTIVDMGSLDDLAMNPPVEGFDQGDEEDDRTIDIEPPRSRPKAVENITETITHVEQREPEPAPKAAPQAAKKPAPPRDDMLTEQRHVPWYEVLGLTGRAFTAAQRAMEQHNIDSIDKARAFHWQMDKVGPATVTELRAALGVPEPDAEPEVKEAPKPVVKAPAKPAERPALQRAPAPVSPPPADDELGWGDVE